MVFPSEPDTCWFFISFAAKAALAKATSASTSDLLILFIDSCLELLSPLRKPASKRRRGRRAPLDEFSQGRQARLECFRKNDREETPQSQRTGPSSLPAPLRVLPAP